MAPVHKGAEEEGRGLLAFFFGNALVEKEDAAAVDGQTKMTEVDPLNYHEVGNPVARNAPRYLTPRIGDLVLYAAPCSESSFSWSGRSIHLRRRDPVILQEPEIYRSCLRSNVIA